MSFLAPKTRARLWHEAHAGAGAHDSPAAHERYGLAVELAVLRRVIDQAGLPRGHYARQVAARVRAKLAGRT